MDDPTQSDQDKNAKQPQLNMREFKPFKINGVAVQGDNDAPCDAEFEWLSDNNDK